MLKDSSSLYDTVAFGFSDERGRKRKKSGDYPENLEIIGERDRRPGAPRKKREAREEEVREPKRLVEILPIPEKSEDKQLDKSENSAKNIATPEKLEELEPGKKKEEEKKKEEKEDVPMIIEKELTEEEKAKERVRQLFTDKIAAKELVDLLLNLLNPLAKELEAQTDRILEEEDQKA